MPLIFQPGYKHFWRQTYAAAVTGAVALSLLGAGTFQVASTCIVKPILASIPASADQVNFQSTPSACAVPAIVYICDTAPSCEAKRLCPLVQVKGPRPRSDA